MSTPSNPRYYFKPVHYHKTTNGHGVYSQNLAAAQREANCVENRFYSDGGSSTLSGESSFSSRDGSPMRLRPKYSVTKDKSLAELRALASANTSCNSSPRTSIPGVDYCPSRSLSPPLPRLTSLGGAAAPLPQQQLQAVKSLPHLATTNYYGWNHVTSRHLDLPATLSRGTGMASRYIEATSNVSPMRLRNY